MSKGHKVLNGITNRKEKKVKEVCDIQSTLLNRETEIKVKFKDIKTQSLWKTSNHETSKEDISKKNQA